MHREIRLKHISVSHINSPQSVHHNRNQVVRKFVLPDKCETVAIFVFFFFPFFLHKYVYLQLQRVRQTKQMNERTNGICGGGGGGWQLKTLL